MEKLISPKKAAKMFGVTPNCLINWEKSGKITATRTAGGQRRYKLKELQDLKEKINNPAN